MTAPRMAKLMQSADGLVDWFVRKQREKDEGDDPDKWAELLAKYWESDVGKQWTGQERLLLTTYAHATRLGRFKDHADWGNIREAA